MNFGGPVMPIPSRVLELQARFGGPSVNVGNAADAFVFGQTLDQVSQTTVVSSEALDLRGAASGPSPATVSSTYGGAVVNPDGTLADNVPYADLFRSAGAEHGIQPSVLAAVAQVESAFDPTAVSSAGALGLMQFMPATAQSMGVDPLDPASAIDGAARYLSENLRRFGSLELALAAYNAGPGAVQRHNGIPPFTETQNYVPKVMAAAGLTPTVGGTSL